MADATTSSTPTPNYNFNLPTVGGDDNAWGGLLNDNWSSIDTLLWTVSGVANAALTQSAGDARYLQLTGGTVGPSTLIVNGAAQFTGGATFGTAQVTFNSQVTFSADALMVTPAAADNSQRAATTAWVRGALAALPAQPAPSNANPTMAGTAAPGTSALYARGDHVHPSDTSRLALAGGTLTGPLTLAADPTTNLQPATKQYVDAGTAAIIGSGAQFGGFVNKLRNGTFDVWQRGTTVNSVNGTYGADGWIANGTGAALTVAQGGPAALPGSPRSFMVISGAAGTTNASITQRIESAVSAPLCGQTCTFQVWVYNGTSAAFTPSVIVQHPTAENNWGATATDLPATAMQSCPPGAWTRCAYTFNAPMAAQALGLGVTVLYSGVLGTQFLNFSAADLRATPGLPVGLCANPPPPELRSIADELAICQRYYETGGINMFSGQFTTGNIYYYTAVFKARKRAGATLAFTDQGNVGFPAGVPTVTSSTVDSVIVQKTANTTTPSGYYTFSWTASAEL